jgi:hypothetical protein
MGQASTDMTRSGGPVSIGDCGKPKELCCGHHNGSFNGLNIEHMNPAKSEKGAMGAGGGRGYGKGDSDGD